MSEWFEPDDEITRRLEQALQQEADAMPIPDQFDRLSKAAHTTRTRRNVGVLVGAAATVAIIAAGGWAVTQGFPPSGGAVAHPPVEAASQAPNTTPDANLPTPTADATGSGESTPVPSTSTPETPGAASGTPDPSASEVPTEPATPPATPKAPAAMAISGPRLAFASPSGNLVCSMTASEGVRCHAWDATWTGSNIPVERTRNCGPQDLNTDFGPLHDVVVTPEGSFGSCVSENSMPEAYVIFEAERHPDVLGYRTWAKPDTKLVETLGGTAYALPYGSTATSGRYACTMERSGVTCTDTRTKAGFHLSRSDIILR